MAAFNKYNCFVEDLAEKVHNLQGDTIKVALTNTAPTAGDIKFNTTTDPAPTAANGYAPTTAGAGTSAQSAGTYKLVLNDVVFTATAGGIGPFEYAALKDLLYQ